MQHFRSKINIIALLHIWLNAISNIQYPISLCKSVSGRCSLGVVCSLGRVAASPFCLMQVSQMPPTTPANKYLVPQACDDSSIPLLPHAGLSQMPPTTPANKYLVPQAPQPCDDTPGPESSHPAGICAGRSNCTGDNQSIKGAIVVTATLHRRQLINQMSNRSHCHLPLTCISIDHMGGKICGLKFS